MRCREERQLLSAHLNDLRVTFAAFLQRIDDKQLTLARFLKDFNSLDEVGALPSGPKPRSFQEPPLPTRTVAGPLTVPP